MARPNKHLTQVITWLDADGCAFPISKTWVQISTKILSMLLRFSTIFYTNLILYFWGYGRHTGSGGLIDRACAALTMSSSCTNLEIEISKYVACKHYKMLPWQWHLLYQEDAGQFLLVAHHHDYHEGGEMLSKKLSIVGKSSLWILHSSA